ncbi:hypothetical protein Nepgr_021694 [Nepenthes gracilis]|uniref:Uncharacterized protein n=1 Tax=Nepenthes gracilis TaxID=150966 RepID=A0AAD3SYP8_NEPGR|nr:hypothetical protein Nepgr_021694 [Nepenthes gracilis]
MRGQAAKDLHFLRIKRSIRVHLYTYSLSAMFKAIGIQYSQVTPNESRAQRFQKKNLEKPPHRSETQTKTIHNLTSSQRRWTTKIKPTSGQDIPFCPACWIKIILLHIPNRITMQANPAQNHIPPTKTKS